MSDALEVLLKKRRRDGRWPVQAPHPGRTHFEMEKPGKPSQMEHVESHKSVEAL